MLSNAYFLAKFRFDTAENEPAKNLQNSRKCIFRKSPRGGCTSGGGGPRGEEERQAHPSPVRPRRHRSPIACRSAIWQNSQGLPKFIENSKFPNFFSIWQNFIQLSAVASPFFCKYVFILQHSLINTTSSTKFELNFENRKLSHHFTDFW